jgi:APA family basic amino acid/polyamine antiporter
MTLMLTFLLGITRVWFSMSRDGLLPPWFAKVDSHGTPNG